MKAFERENYWFYMGGVLLAAFIVGPLGLAVTEPDLDRYRFVAGAALLCLPFMVAYTRDGRFVVGRSALFLLYLGLRGGRSPGPQSIVGSYALGGGVALVMALSGSLAVRAAHRVKDLAEGYQIVLATLVLACAVGLSTAIVNGQPERGDDSEAMRVEKGYFCPMYSRSLHPRCWSSTSQKLVASASAWFQGSASDADDAAQIEHGELAKPVPMAPPTESLRVICWRDPSDARCGEHASARD